MIKSIIKNFEQNKLSTQILLNKEKKMELNSLNNVTEKNVEFLLSEGDCSCEENSINNENNSYRLCSKLVKLFNEKTNDILNTSQNNLQTFSKIKYQFSKDLINNFQNIRFSENNLKKLRNKYIEANEIMEQINEDKIKRAKQLEKKFYEIKNEENYSKSEIKYRELLDLENLESKKRKYILSFLRNRINQELRQTLNIKKINPNIKYNNLYKKEEKLKNAHIIYKNYINKKIKLNAISFDNNIKKIINEKDRIKNSKILDEQSKNIKMIYKDIIKMKEINKIKNKKREDEFNKENKKLKKGMIKCEDEYYRVIVFNNKNLRLSFLKPILRAKTIKKYINIQQSNFGIP